MHIGGSVGYGSEKHDVEQDEFPERNFFRSKDSDPIFIKLWMVAQVSLETALPKNGCERSN